MVVAAGRGAGGKPGGVAVDGRSSEGARATAHAQPQGGSQGQGGWALWHCTGNRPEAIVQARQRRRLTVAHGGMVR